MKKLLFGLVLIVLILGAAYLVLTKYVLVPRPPVPVFTNPPVGSGIWSGQGVMLRFTDLKTNEAKDYLVGEGPIGFETPFSSRTILKKSDFVSNAEIIFEKGGKKKEFTLKRGDTLEFEGVKIEFSGVGGTNSPCPPGAKC